LEVGYVTSTDSGTTWSAPRIVAGPMKVSQLARTDMGNMVGDYIATSVLHGRAFSLFAVGKKAVSRRAFNEALYTVGGLPITGGPVKAIVGPVLTRRGDVRERLGGPAERQPEFGRAPLLVGELVASPLAD
jgi:hypothetical protein